jgi:putative phosphoesterase
VILRRASQATPERPPDVRVAALADVHGNLPALAAVLSEVEREGVDLVVCCGDLAGPLADECLERLLALGDGVRFVRGNADEGVDWPLTVAVEIDGLGRVLFCHGSPRSEHEILTRISSAERVAAALAGVEADVVVGGHTHVQFDRAVGGRRLVNAGSIGMPYEGVRGAFWALLGPDVELRRTAYDVEAAAAQLEATAYPGAAEQAGWLLEPPDPTEVSAYFESQASEAGA